MAVVVLVDVIDAGLLVLAALEREALEREDAVDGGVGFASFLLLLHPMRTRRSSPTTSSLKSTSA